MKRREFIASLAEGTRRRVGFLAMDVVEPTVQKEWLDGLRRSGGRHHSVTAGDIISL